VLHGTLKNIRAAAAHLAANPRDLKDVPRWLRELNATTMDLRKPWWPFAVIDYVESALPPNARVFEFGGGGSSLWLADHGAHITTVEQDSDWGRQLRDALPEQQAEVLVIPPSTTGQIASSAHTGFFDDYVSAIDSYPEDFDLVIVDGRARVDCALRAGPKVKRGGLLLLDDSNRPRYARAVREFESWPSRSVTGFKPGSSVPETTTIWTRPF
jgi:hypothetical protein